MTDESKGNRWTRDNHPPGAGPWQPGQSGNPAGGASKYDPRYCELAVEFGAKGYSLWAFAGEVGVSRRTIHNWMETYPDFREAVEIHKGKRLYSWETAGIKVRDHGGERDQFAMITMGLANMAADEWGASQKQRHELTGKDGGPIATVDLSKLSNEQLAALEPVLLALAGSGAASGAGEGGEGEAGG